MAVAAVLLVMAMVTVLGSVTKRVITQVIGNLVALIAFLYPMSLLE
jgi:hypothetical protein